MNAETRVRHNPRIVYQRLAGEAGGVLLNLDTNAYHNLNPTGVLIWELLEAHAEVGDLVAAFESQFEEGPGTLRDDLFVFLAELAERELILVEEPDAVSTAAPDAASAAG
jgi:hypothetical protein